MIFFAGSKPAAALDGPEDADPPRSQADLSRGDGSIGGQVLDRLGTPRSGVAIIVAVACQDAHAILETDDDGRFEVTGLPVWDAQVFAGDGAAEATKVVALTDEPNPTVTLRPQCTGHKVLLTDPARTVRVEGLDRRRSRSPAILTG